jgi:hypothetical protein
VIRNFLCPKAKTPFGENGASLGKARDVAGGARFNDWTRRRSKGSKPQRRPSKYLAGRRCLSPKALKPSVQVSEAASGGAISNHLTPLRSNAALLILQCEARMSEVLADIVSAFGRELDAASLEKTRCYLEALKTAVRSDDLPAYGLAYLEHLHNPDPRYSGC